MSQEDHDDHGPFHAFCPVRKDDMTTPAAKRTAFGKDPHGVLVFGKNSQCRIAREGTKVRKSGSRVQPTEGAALAFAHSLQIPVPAVHEVKASSEETHILMDFVSGECLEEAWLSMDSEQKQSIAEQIRDVLTTMRQATSGQRRIGAIDGPARDCRGISDHIGGPFHTEAEFNNFVCDFLRGTPSTIRSILTDAMNTNSRIVFTHGDLTPRNIIVKGDRLEAILDWEYAGWYPEYFEYVKFFDRPTDCKDWKEYADVMFPTRYPKELLTHQALARWQLP